MLDCRAQDHEIKAHALYSIGRVKALLASISNLGQTAAPYVTHAGMKTMAWAQPAPQDMRLHATTSDSMEADLNAIATDCNAKPCPPNIALAGRIARMCDPVWWVHNLRRETVKENETIQHAAGDIRRKLECYATDHAVRVKAARAIASRMTLEGLEVVNETGAALNLQEVADRSVSNPAIRRGELMVRARGFEEIAEMMGHGAYFLTLTCPSRFHRFTGSGKLNRAWTGETPRDAQDWLCEAWAKIRAAWGHRGIFPYGFRVAEPHHDGCPHWHILIFVNPVYQQVAADFVGPVRHRAAAPRLCAIVRRYVLDHGQANEKDVFKQVYNRVPYRFACQATEAAHGKVHAWKVATRAAQNRDTARKTHAADFKTIDTTKGSATGYIAKYISKNIDGMKEAKVIDGVRQQPETMGLDFASGTNAATSAQRVKTWASTWGIRQFQQVGGPSVSVWRELRRLGEVTAEQWAQGDLFAMAQNAANIADWGAFWHGQGGPNVRRSELTLSPAYAKDQVNKYGEEVARIVGVNYDSATDSASLKTRLHTWVVQVAGLAEVNAMQSDHRAELATEAAVQRFYRAAGLSGHSEFLTLGAPCAPWTGVNNCTDTTEKPAFAGFDFSGFEQEHWEIPYLPKYSRRGDPDLVAEEVALLEGNTCQTTPAAPPRNEYEHLRG